MDFYKELSMRKILLFVALVLVGCAEAKPKVQEDVIAVFKHRHELMREAMRNGNIDEAQRLSRETNAWLDSLSDDEQFLISKSLTK
jgi:hypothetical protein